MKRMNRKFCLMAFLALTVMGLEAAEEENAL